MHTIVNENNEDGIGEMIKPSFVDRQDLIRYVNLKRKYSINENENENHLQIKSMKRNIVPSDKNNHTQQHHQQHLLQHNQQIIVADDDSMINHQEHHNNQQNHHNTNHISSTLHDKHNINLIQSSCEVQMAHQIEYVNVMFDNSLLPVQNQIISEANYIDYTVEDLNDSNWNNVDLLDLDQRNLFFDNSSNVINTATLQNHYQDKNDPIAVGREDYQNRHLTRIVPSKLIIKNDLIICIIVMNMNSLFPSPLNYKFSYRK